MKIVEQTENIASLFDMSHCFISASIKETMSMAIAEASIYGLPVIQSDIPGTYWNADNASTYLFHVNNSKDLASQMNKVLNCPVDILAEKCKTTSEINKKNLSMQKWVNKIIDIYLKV